MILQFFPADVLCGPAKTITEVKQAKWSMTQRYLTVWNGIRKFDTVYSRKQEKTCTLAN
jgi:hypothetical protein